MASKKGEARTAVARQRASELSYRIDPSDIAPHSLAIHRISTRYGVSHAHAAVICELAFQRADSWRGAR